MMNRTKERQIPKNLAAKIQDKQSSAVAYLYTLAGAPYAQGFRGKQIKPAFHYRFRNEAEREAEVARFFRAVREGEAAKAKSAAERKAEAAKGHSLEVGHVIYSSWGYDQTNVNFYEVTKLIGSSMVELRELAQITEGSGYGGGGKCYPKLGSYIGEPQRRRVMPGNRITFESFQHGSVWDGQAKYWSADH